MMDKELLHSKVNSLVRRFEANKYHYLSRDYLEEEVKIDFINPLFEALGWDIRNTKGLSPYEREVVVEKGETTGRPDYNFRIDGQTKFFIEAKAPHEPLNRIKHVLQAKSYAWNTKNVFIVLLTDFEEFRLFDATIKPDVKNPNQGLIFELTYDQYLKNIDKLLLLSKEEVEKGSLDKLILKDSQSRKLRIPVDKAFLEDISRWREDLAKDIYKRNIEALEDRSDEKRVKIQVKILNEAVQKILDRLIFIRIAEDRKIIEPKSLLDEVEWWKAGGKRRNLQRRLTDRFLGWNQDFNGEILKPGPCDVLEIDSHLLAKIIDGLYFPKCPYRFDVIGVELLGSIYERYLGKTIKATPKRVKIEDKPEVRKAGGVYYTPQYIVDYIVKNTVGNAIKGKTPKQLEKIKILDPACGSGSFLLSAFQTLLDYHLEYYLKHPEESAKGTLFPDVIHDYEGNRRLSIEKKAQILRNNIFGVDIDPQAIEITMMSLYLKCLEGEKDLPRKKELLPSLYKNLKCGNSLISFNIFDQLKLFSEGDKERINPFDWYSTSTGFGLIMNKGGFDIILGNPPYIRIQRMIDWAPLEIEFYKKHYTTASTGNYDIYTIFVERALQLLNKNGIMGYILPHKFFQAKYGQPLRKLLANGDHVIEIVHFGNQQVFLNATTYTCLLFLSKAGRRNFRYIKVDDINKWESKGIATVGKISNDKVTEREWNFIIGPGKFLFERLEEMKVKLKDIAHMFVGLQTDADDVYILNEVEKDEDLVYCKSKVTNKIHKFENNHLKHFVKGSLNIRRYYLSDLNKRLIFPYEIMQGRSILIDEKTYRTKYPLTWAYLMENKNVLSKRGQGRLKRSEWYGYVYKKNHTRFVLSKLLVPSIALGSCFASDLRGEFYFVGSGGGGGGGYGITLFPNIGISHNYLLGLLNSRVLNYFIKQISTPFRGGYLALSRQYIEQLPIRMIDLNNEKEKEIYNKIEKKVADILNLYEKYTSVLSSSKKEMIKREIIITDEEIDNLVYELYGISRDEKQIIETHQNQ